MSLSNEFLLYGLFAVSVASTTTSSPILKLNRPISVFPESPKYKTTLPSCPTLLLPLTNCLLNQSVLCLLRLVLATLDINVVFYGVMSGKPMMALLSS